MKSLLLTLLLAALPGPTMTWTPELRPTADGYELVLTGEVQEGYYTHPMRIPHAGVSLSLETEGVEAAGEPAEQYTPSDYKGEEVVSGTYVLRQGLKIGAKVSEVRGNVRWSACSGDDCFPPEEFAFGLPVPRTASGGLWGLILEAILWGLLMLLTPCVFPMVPMTVSFFLKQSASPARGRFRALMYGLFIVLLYTVPVCVIIGVTWLVGGSTVTADIFNWLSTHWLPNILFFLVFMVFAASFFGAFEMVLPSGWTTKADEGSGRKGLAGVFFLALTLVLVSFSCTGPIVGTVLIKSTQGEFWTPMVTMLAFSIAFALPFVLLAFFPSILNKLPRSGGWLNSVKVVLGFIEIALGLKFLSTADQTYHWHILDRDIYLAIWIVCFTLLGLYLLGKIRFKHDEPLAYLSVGRLSLVIADFAFVVYLLPGMWGAPLKALSGYLPPLETQDFVLGAAPQHPVEEAPLLPSEVSLPHGLSGFTTLEDGLAAAAASGKKVFVDITGHGCVHCREMEARVWSDSEVLRHLKEDYVIVALFVDDKTRLPESEWVRTESGSILKDIGRVNSHLVMERFGVNSQPNYLILDPDGSVLRGPRGYSLDIPAFVDFLTF